MRMHCMCVCVCVCVCARVSARAFMQGGVCAVRAQEACASSCAQGLCAQRVCIHHVQWVRGCACECVRARSCRELCAQCARRNHVQAVARKHCAHKGCACIMCNGCMVAHTYWVRAGKCGHWVVRAQRDGKSVSARALLLEYYVAEVLWRNIFF